MNVNFPSVEPDQAQGIHVVRHGQRKVGDDLIERTDPRGRSYFWIGTLRARPTPCRIPISAWCWKRG